MFTSNRQIPIATLVDFLSTNELVEFAQVNRTIYTNTKYFFLFFYFLVIFIHRKVRVI